MDFITRLPTSSRGNDSIWLIVDKLSKFAHFLPVKTTYQSLKLAELYIARIISLHVSPQEHRIGLRNSVYLEILEEGPRRFRNPTRFQHSLSPSDLWTNRASKSNTRRYVESMCARVCLNWKTVSLSQNFHTTTVIKLVFNCPHLNSCMEGSVAPL